MLDYTTAAHHDDGPPALNDDDWMRLLGIQVTPAPAPAPPTPTPAPAPAPTPAPAPAPAPKLLSGLNSPDLSDPNVGKGADDLAAALYCAARLVDRAIYVDKFEWMIWSDTHWIPDPKMRRISKEVAILLRHREIEALGAGLDDLAKASRPSDSRVRAVVNMMSSFLLGKDYAVEFPPAPSAWNLQNGVVDLRTGDLIPHHHTQRHTTVGAADYHPAAHSDLWEECLTNWFPDVNLRWYVHVLCGYLVTGYTNLEIFCWFHGLPRSGKGTFLGAIRSVMGNLSSEIETRDLLQSEQKPWALLGVHDKRLVLADETSEGRRAILNQNLLKKLTGGGLQTFETKGKQPIAVESSARFCVMSNSLPSTAGADPAFWASRLVLIPFGSESHIGKEDVLLKQRLAEPEHRRAIVAWLVRGAYHYFRLGQRLPPVPAAVTAAIAAARVYSDQLGAWIDDCVLISKDGDITCYLSSLYESYNDWCRTNGELPDVLTSKFLSKRLGELGYRSVRTSRSGGVMDYRFYGLALRSDITTSRRSVSTTADDLTAKYAPPEMGFQDGVFVGGKG